MPVPFRPPLRLLISITGIVGGGIASILGAGVAADVLWGLTGGIELVPMGIASVRELRNRRAGVDVIAILAVIGALALNEYLAAAVIGLMLATGQALEDYAQSRADRDLSALLHRAPRLAHRIDPSGVLTIPVEQVNAGDLLVIREADVIPVDGRISEGPAVLDESALTGESHLITREVGETVRSGTTNAGGVFQIRAMATSEHSAYAGIVRLVESARESKAPMLRLADQYAQYFIPFTLIVAGIGWAVARDPIGAVAVLVVATPCPLILAAPIAIVAGMSRAARRGIVVKGGGALEALARARVLLLDKTGTITTGTPQVQGVRLYGSSYDAEQVLELAASLDQVSSHVLAAALLSAARERRLPLTFPTNVHEEAGTGMSGEVADHGVRIGTFEFAVRGLPSDDRFQSFRRRVMRDASAAVFVTIDEQLAGAIVMEDTVRPEAARVLREVKRHGIHETVMVTGDDPAVATAVGHALGLDRVLSALSPADKVAAVREAAKTMPTLMVGDGINDAPALAAAGVGIAMGAAGATASSEAADAVIMVDRLDRVVDALDIARRSRGIALQSVLVGMGLSMVAMGFAAAGFLPPVQGAILQEGIDLLAILIALRAATGRLGPGRAPAIDERLAVQLREDHRHLRGALGLIREVGDQIDELAPAEAVDRLHEVSAFLDMIVEHERNDEWVVLPSIARAVGGDDPLAAISRTHQEVFQLTGSFNRLVADIAASGLEPEDLTDIRRLLYSLSALLELNIAQEEDLYATLHDEYFELSVPAAS